MEGATAIRQSQPSNPSVTYQAPKTAAGEIGKWIAIIIIVIVVAVMLGTILQPKTFRENIQNIRSARRFSLATQAATRRGAVSAAQMRAMCRQQCAPIVQGYGYTGIYKERKIRQCVGMCLADRQDVLDNIFGVLGNTEIGQS